MFGSLPHLRCYMTKSFEGYVMDYYCIERGTLLDNPGVNTLEGPEQHSVHWYVKHSLVSLLAAEIILQKLC
jgi:hypothetical protein